MAAKDDGNADGAPDDRPKPFDLANIKAGAEPPKAFRAGKDVTDVVSGAKADRVGQFARGDFPVGVSEVLKRALVAADPLSTAMERAGLIRGGVAEQAVRDAMRAHDLGKITRDLGITGSLVDKANAASIYGSLIDAPTAASIAREAVLGRTARELMEADRKMSNLILGRTVADRELVPSIGAIVGKLGTLDHVSQYATGRASASALGDAYAALGIGKDRARMLGYVAGVGSLARIAAGLGDHASVTGLRASAMFVEAQRQIDANASLDSIRGALRTGYPDLFPAMRLPRGSEIDAVIAARQQRGPIKGAVDWETGARLRLEQLATPWVLSEFPDASISAMARLGDLGHLVQHRSPSDAGVIDMLRTRLGDYRQAEAPDPEALKDPISRTAYRLEQGFDPFLTALPTAVAAVVLSPLGAELSSEEVDPDTLENLVRMMMKRLEHALRRFIVEKLESLYGERWFDELPSDIRRGWAKSRQRSIDAGRPPQELIAYADIDDYRKIIEHPDRWSRLFEPTFKDQGAIRETLRRIAPIRNDGAHFRPVTLEDLIIIRAEGIHLSRWLGAQATD